MREENKKIMWTILSLLIAACTIWAVSMQSKNFSMKELGIFLERADKKWMALALLCMVGFIFFEGCALTRLCCISGHMRNVHHGMLYSAADVYFSAITPSASGGQPASAFFMMRDGIPGPTVTTALLLNAVMHTLALFVIGTVSFLLKFQIFLSFSLFSRVFIGIGAVVLLLLAGTFLFALKKGEWLYRICSVLIQFLEKIHLIRNGEVRIKKLSATLEDYKKSSQLLTGHKRILLEVFFWNICQRIAQFGVSFMVFKATGFGTRIAARVWMIQSFVSVGSNCVPIPGSMGVADYLMLDGFSQMIGMEDAAYMELICRGISFYGCVLTSILIVLAGYFSGRRKNLRSKIK